MKQAILWHGLPGGRVECTACARRCRIPDGSHGFCFVRQNRGGQLYLANYGVVDAMQIDPIEKKPFNHFMPGSYVFGLGTSSCNWGCLFCQNHNISKERDIKGVKVSPEDAVARAVMGKAQGIAFTYNEPTIFIEYALDVAKVAHGSGLPCVFVSNGYMTEEAVREMRGKIDAVVVNWKGNGERKFANRYETIASGEPIRHALEAMKRYGMHIEMTDLVIPRVGDSLEACGELTRWVRESLGPDVPMHFTMFHPDYKMLDYPQTPYATLKRHYDIARANGLNYVYIGNVQGNPYESTYCPRCAALAIGRDGFSVTEWAIDGKNRCRECGTSIPVTGRRPERFEYRGIESIY